MDTEKKKKIVVLVMSCQDPFFRKEEMVCRDTWAKPILDKEYDNIEYFSYTGGHDRSYVDFNDHHIYCKSGDGIFETYQKTYEVFKLLDKFFEYIYQKVLLRRTERTGDQRLYFQPCGQPEPCRAQGV